MKFSWGSTAIRYMGVVAACLVPALVVAQQALPAFGAGTVLTANDLQAVTRELTTLRNNALSKDNLYSVVADSGPVAQNGVGTAQASCRDDSDILISCGCSGSQGGANSLQFDLRHVNGANPPDGTSLCRCQGVNVGTDVARNLIATASCLAVP